MWQHNYIRRIILIFIILINNSIAENDRQICYLFSHGIADTHRQAYRYLKNTADLQRPFIVEKNLITFDYPDATLGPLRVNRHQASLAQDHDIVHLAHRFYQNVDTRDQAVVIGVSRGASTALTFMAWYKPETVPALILESPFDSMDSIIRSLIHRSGLSWIPGSTSAGLAILCCLFKKYNNKGLKPLQAAENVPLNLPVLLVCSLQDSLVPAWSTMTIYAALKATGNPYVYLLILPEGMHAQLINHPIYGNHYQEVVHAFYRQHRLPHDPELAQKGQNLFNNCQPDAQELISYIPSYAVAHFENWQKSL